MNSRTANREAGTRACVTSDELYRYVAEASNPDERAELERHFASCASCREELSELLHLLYPEGREAPEEFETSQSEIDHLVSIVRKTGKPARSSIRPRWLEWAAAAAAVALSVTGIWGYKIYSERSRSAELFAQAESNLEEFYQSDSPSGLLLDLPFQPGGTTRSANATDALEKAKTLFVQALALRPEMVEAHLGLGSVYMTQLQFPRAREQFQKVLDTRAGHLQAMVGRGVALSEEARTSTDPAEQSRLLARALADFDAALAADPSTLAARYNRVQILVETGRHKQALEEIEHYLSRDSSSLWAERLKSLRTRITLSSDAAFEKEVRGAAARRDQGAIEALAAVVPARFPAAIRSALKRSLQVEGALAGTETPAAGDDGWAAAALEKSYRSATGDSSYSRLVRFYAGLSPPERKLKQSLDARFDLAVERHRKGDLASALLQATSLLPDFIRLEDHWQILNVHQLRGYCFYYGSADFDGAIAAYGQMLEAAERTACPDLIARSLASLAAASLERGLFDQSLKLGTRLSRIAREHGLESWLGYAGMTRGTVYRNLNAFEPALSEYSAALSLARRLRDESVLPNVLEDLALMMDRMGRLEDARAFYREALLQHDSFADGTVRAPSSWISRRLNLLNKQADLALRQSDFETAERLFRESLSGSGNMRELEARNRLGLAQVYLAMKRPDDARSMLQACRKIASTGKYPEIEWQTEFTMGRLLREGGRNAEAAAAFESAVSALENMRHSIGSDGMRHAFLGNRFGPHRELVSILFHSPDGRRKAREWSERSKSITLREYLMENAKDGPGAREFWSGVREPRPSEALLSLEYFQGTNELYMFLVGPGIFESASAAVTAEQIALQVQKFRSSIRNGDESSFTGQSRKLYGELIAPVERHLELRRGETLAILPDGPLHTLPFAALLDSAGKFLIEKRPLVFAPSQSILGYCMSLDRGSASGRDRTVLLLDGTANLPAAGGELALVSRLYGGNTLLLRGEDLPGRPQAVEKSEIIHFAGHSETAEGQPALAFGSRAYGSTIGPGQISGWQLRRNRLVNLAGCNTALGPQSAGEAPWGLVPAFLGAGAPALIASVLPVEDDAAGNLNRLFYDQLASGAAKAAALQRAQLALLADSRRSHRIDATNWTPFVLIGDPR